MIKFLRNFSASLTALFVFFVFLPFFMLSFLSAVFMAANTSELSPGKISGGGVFVLDLSLPIGERVEDENSLAAAIEGLSSTSVYNAVQIIRDASCDRRVKAILIRGSVDESGAGLAAIAELREAVCEACESLSVYAYLENPSLRDYFIATAASEIILNPFSEFEFKGISTSAPYFGNAFKKYGIDAQIVRAGKHKSFGDIFTKSKMDGADKEILKSVVGGIWECIISKISESRNLTPEFLREFADSKAICSAEEAKKLKLVDKLMYDDELIDMLAQKYGSEGDSFKQVFVDSFPAASRAGNIAIVYMSGDIVEADISPSVISSERYVGILRKLRSDSSIKGVVLRIDSGGGSAYASEVIRREVELLAKEKPVVASFSSVAASGAYWIATAADNIFLMPETITGSIGVFSIAFSVEKFAGGYGVDFDGVKTSPFADIGTLTRPMGERELALTGKMVREVYDRFVDLVCKSRKISPAELAEIADGRIFDGATAVRLNLADGFGTLDEVVAALMEKCECDGVKEYPKIDRFKEFMKSFSAAEPFAKSVPPKLKAYLDSIKSLSAYSDKRGIYARIPFDIALK